MANFPNSQSNDAGAIPTRAVGGSSFAHLAAVAGTLLKTGAGQLNNVAINTLSATAVLTLYDGTDDTGTVIAIVHPTALGGIPYGLAFTVGLYAKITVAATADLTIVYS